MKHLNVIVSLCLLFLSLTLQAQHNHGSHNHHPVKKEAKKKPDIEITDIFIVYGNCGMCEKRIEGALINVNGIHSADWDKNNKVITVKYNDEVISLDEIKEKVAKVGHDTDKFRAKDEIYNSLPSCCQYERPKE